MTEDELLRMLDGDDHEALLVCADWLEGQGRIDTANVLRGEHRLRTAPRPKDLVDLGVGLAKQIKKIPAAWLARMAPHAPVGKWTGHDSDLDKWEFAYLDDGKLSYANNGDWHKDGEWKQIGSLLVMFTNKKFTTYVGLITSDRITGSARTRSGLGWNWEVSRVEAPVKRKIRARRPDKARRQVIQGSRPKKKKPAKKKRTRRA